MKLFAWRLRIAVPAPVNSHGGQAVILPGSLQRGGVSLGETLLAHRLSIVDLQLDRLTGSLGNGDATVRLWGGRGLGTQVLPVFFAQSRAGR